MPSRAVRKIRKLRGQLRGEGKQEAIASPTPESPKKRFSAGDYTEAKKHPPVANTPPHLSSEAINSGEVEDISPIPAESGKEIPTPESKDLPQEQETNPILAFLIEADDKAIVDLPGVGDKTLSNIKTLIEEGELTLETLKGTMSPSNFKKLEAYFDDRSHS